MRGFLRRLRGIVGNGLVWAVGWAFGAAAFLLLPLLLGLPPGVRPWPGILGVAGMFGGMGFLCGAAFSAYLGLVGRNKRLEELGAIRYGLRGAVASGLILPVVAFVLHGPGDFPFWVQTFGQSAIAIVLGGLSAFGTVKLAQRSDRVLASATLGEMEAEQRDVLSLLGEES